MDYDLYTVAYPGGKPTLASVAQDLGLPVTELDQGYGVNLVDKDGGVYAVRIQRQSARSVDLSASRVAVEGPYSDPEIGPANFMI